MHKSLQALKVSATKSAKIRGHKMKPWLPIDGGAFCQCGICDQWVQVLVKPQANQIDIGGPAVAINCIKNLNKNLWQSAKI